MYKWILIFCLPLGSFAEVSLCSKRIAHLTNTPKTTGFLKTLRAVFARENTAHEQTHAAAAIQGSHSVQPLVDPMLAERPRKPAGRPIFTKGLDEANRMIQLAERLRNSQIDPHTTHIPEFADDIPKHISFIKEGIEKFGEEKEARLKKLAELEKEALKKAKNKQVTYEWWLEWNTQLASIVSLYTYTSFGVIVSRAEIFPMFPDIIMVPTVSDFGIQAFNRSLSHNVFPLGIVNQPTFADGILIAPLTFLSHDFTHTANIVKMSKISSLSKIENNFNINLYQELQKLDLSLEQQEMIDIIYFSMLHEEFMYIHLFQNWQESKSFVILKTDYDITRFQKEGNLRELLPASVNADSKEEIEAYLNKSTQLFEQLGHQILKAAVGTNNPSLTSVES